MRPLGLLAVLVALSSGSSAFASTTRLLSLGLDNWQVQDDANLWFNPALLPASKDLAEFEIGAQGSSGGGLTAGSQWGGLHKTIRGSTVALYLRRPYATNDFSATASPLLVPGLGGFISAANVVGVSGLSTSGFGATGPFGGSANTLGITGAPTLTQTVAVPANYFDAFWARPYETWTLGGHVNYARNAPGEISESLYDSGGSAATPGTISRDRSSSEWNAVFGGNRVLDKEAGTVLDVVAAVSRPSFSTTYEALRTNGAFARGNIGSSGALGASLAARWSTKIDGDTLALTGLAASQNVSGTADRTEAGASGSPLTTNQSASYDNTRKSLLADGTWSHPFGTSLLIASLGVQLEKTRQSWSFTDALSAANAEDDFVEQTNLIFPLRVAAELKPFSRLVLRAGIQKNVLASTKKVISNSHAGAAANVTETHTAIAEAAGTANGVGLSLGAGIWITRSLLLDAVVRQTLLFDSPNVVGGTTPGLFAQSTLSYAFGSPSAPTSEEPEPEAKPRVRRRAS